MARKSNLRDLSIFPPTEAEFDELYNALRDAHPTTAAILGAIMVEHALDMRLREQFKRQDDDTWKALVDEGPLGSFAHKIKAGYAFGLFEDDVRTNLDVIRHIRNAFAHSRKLLPFNHRLILRQLTRVKAGNTLDEGDRLQLEAVPAMAQQKDPDAEQVKKCFIGLCQVITGILARRPLTGTSYLISPVVPP
jgi:hypothetical protein